MTDNLKVIVTTVALFVSGLLVGIWTQRMAPLPPPLIGPMGEFGAFRGRVFGPVLASPPPKLFFGIGPGGQVPPTPEEIRKLTAELTPQIEAFQKQLSSIEEEFRSAFERILTSEQKEKLGAILQRLASFPGPLPGCGPEMGPIFVSTIIYRPIFEQLSKDLDLREDQRQKLSQLLIERRNKLLSLVDKTPPPSFKLGEMIVTPPADPTPQ
jgi:hypothetical protein